MQRIDHLPHDLEGLFACRHTARSEGAARQGDGAGIARGDDDRRRHGSTAARTRGQEQFLDLSA